MSRLQRVYLSPHLDDVALSCGGQIFQSTQTGASVLVVTLFAGSPWSGGGCESEARSDYIAVLHQRWGTDADAPALRRVEDRSAMRVLGADYLHLSYLDCVYRRHSVTDEFLYRSDEAIFAGVHLVDFPLVDELVDELVGLVKEAGEVKFYSPLAVGHHVDHQIVAAVALMLQAIGHWVAFYEDYPYAETPEALVPAAQWVGGENWRWEFVPLCPQDLEAKTNAVLQYRSQLSTFFNDDAQVAQRLRAYATGIGSGRGLCERIWHLTK